MCLKLKEINDQEVLYSLSLFINHIGGLIVGVLASSASGQTKDYKIDICCFSAKH